MSIKSLKVTTLAENLVLAGGLGQWGLSLLMELEDSKGDQRKVLMDTATVPKALIHNIEHLELDLSDLDSIVLSHGHFDHSSATTQIIEMTGGVKVYAHSDLFNEHASRNKKGKIRKVGVPEGQRISDIETAGGEVVLSKKPVEVVPGLWTTGEVPRLSFETPMELRPGTELLIMKDGDWEPDTVVDDQSLYADVDGFGPVVLSGCAHAGPLNILNHVKDVGGYDDIAGFVGGTHLVGRKDEYLMRSIEGFKDYGFKVFSPCHCTGFKATAMLWQALPKNFVLNFCCRKIDFHEPVKNPII